MIIPAILENNPKKFTETLKAIMGLKNIKKIPDVEILHAGTIEKNNKIYCSLRKPRNKTATH